MDIKGKVALITGAGGDFGKGVAKLLLERKCKVAIVDNRKEAGENAQRDLAKSFGRDNVIFLQCDVTNEEEFENAFIEAINKFGKLNIVVNSAGVAELPNWRKVYAINTMAVYSGNLFGLKHMDKSRGWEGGHIVNVASITGFMACPPVPSYASAKAAVISFTRAFGSDIFFKRTGVTVNCICPDAMDTPLLKGLLDACVHGGPDAIAVGKYFQESILNPEKVALGVIKLIEERVNGAALIALRTKEFVYRKFDM